MSTQLEEIRTTIQNSLDVFRILQEDMDEAADLLVEDASNFRLRTYTRSFFALVEGSMFGLKRIALKINEHQPCFTCAEVTLLKEVTYELSDRGIVSEKPRFLVTLSNVRFIVKCFAKAFGFESEGLFGGTGWQRFQQALEIRHQITHPKNATSLIISELDDGKGAKVDVVAEAAEWYGTLIMQLSQSMGPAIKQQYESRKESVGLKGS